jgi:hypothetical protein
VRIRDRGRSRLSAGFAVVRYTGARWKSGRPRRKRRSRVASPIWRLIRVLPALDQSPLALPSGGAAQPAHRGNPVNVTRESALGTVDPSAVCSHSGVLPQLRTLRPAVKQYEIGIRPCCRQGRTYGCKNHGITERGDLYRLCRTGSNPPLTPTRGPHGQPSGTDKRCLFIVSGWSIPLTGRQPSVENTSS